jgi:NTP pyrophosphatase (non-canonical NTP hydrolase)
MEIREAQRDVQRFSDAHGLNHPAAVRVLDLVSEVGEVAKEVLKASDYGRHEFAVMPSWDDEIGDILYSLIALANETNVDLETALRASLDKYEARLDTLGSAGSGR